jgi:hypothetical protein
MGYFDEQLKEELQFAKDLIVERYLGKPSSVHVAGVGIGDKYVKGKPVYQSVRVYVSTKQTPEDVTPRELIPRRIGNIDTDVVELGAAFIPDKTGIHSEPAPEAGEVPTFPEPGCSIGLNSDSTRHLGRLISGSLGAVLAVGDAFYLVSCNHVISANGRAKNARIQSPAPLDAASDKEPEVIASDPVHLPLKHDQVNTVDAAIARLSSDAAENLSPIAECTSAQVGDRVYKVGKTTRLTFGRVVDVSADILVEYPFGTFQFTNQMLIEGERGRHFAGDGDSGALVIHHETKRAVGMVVAPTGHFTAACSILEVLRSFSSQGAESGLQASARKGDAARPVVPFRLEAIRLTSY